VKIDETLVDFPGQQESPCGRPYEALSAVFPAY
jgi:hypothetical protein